LVEEEVARMTEIQRAGGVSEMELLRLRADANARRASAEAAEFAVATLDRDRQVAVGSRRARIAELERELAELEGQVSVKTAQLDELTYSLRQRLIRTPAAGHIGEVADLEVGAVVHAGERLGSVVPDGEVRVVALFPARALGRIRTGQQARMRLTGFSWMEYGALPARVASVASEPARGQFRVELRLDAPHRLATPVQHGLPGSVAVEVDRVSPATLVLRAVGRLTELERVPSVARRGAA
jgi:multidrug resistance efflux pump